MEKESLERGLAKLDMMSSSPELSDRLSAMVKARYDADGEEVWITEDNCDASFSRQDNSEDVSTLVWSSTALLPSPFPLLKRTNSLQSIFFTLMTRKYFGTQLISTPLNLAASGPH